MSAIADKFIPAGYTRADTVGLQKTYSIAGQVVLAATPTEIVQIANPTTSTITIGMRRIKISGLSTAAQNIPVTVVKRSAPTTAGTSTTPTPVPHFTPDGAAQAVVSVYTANPTVGTPIGTVRSQLVTFVAPTTAGGMFMEEKFTEVNDKSISLQAGESLSVVLAGPTVSGASMDFELEWIEA